MSDAEKLAKEKAERKAKLEKELATVRKLEAGLKADLEKETDPVRREDFEAQIVLTGRGARSIESELKELESAPKDSPKRLRSVFGRR